MMTFYAAVGTYRIITENGKRMPYIQQMGKLHPISIPEFFIWSTLLWEVMTYEELKGIYDRQQETTNAELPGFDRCLAMLIRRKLIVRGTGYTGVDALYNMLDGTFLTPVRVQGFKKIPVICRLLHEKKIKLKDAVKLMRPESHTADERRILGLINQTPLSVSELIRCLDNGVYDVHTPDRVIDAVYSEESDTQTRMHCTSNLSDNRQKVLEAAANLYLARKVILEHI